MKVAETVSFSTEVNDLWDVIHDIPVVAKCIPGVEEFSADDENDNIYKGRIKMKFGPVSVNFKGQITVEEMDEEQKRIAMKAQASDTKMGSNVKMIQSMFLVETEDGTDMTVEADVDIRGKLAQIGWGLIQPKVTSTLQEFAANLKDLIQNSEQLSSKL